MNIFKKIKFLLTKPKAVIVIGQGRKAAKEAIFQVLKQHFKIGKEILIFESELKNSTGVEKFNFLVKNSSLPILVVAHITEILSDQDFFAGNQENTTEIQQITKLLPGQGYLVLNFDNDAAKEIKSLTNAKTLTFGFQEKADIWISDVNSDINETNFKINYQGKIVPIWLKNIAGKEQIYASISAVAVGIILGLNLVEISQALRNYRGLLTK